MAQLFVSHSSADNPLALRVRECLGDLGYQSVFLDVAPTDGLIPGAAWRDQLFTNLDRSDALVLVGTPTANTSLWCHSELALARWLRKPILSLLFDGVDPHELVADIQGINLASADLSPDLVRAGLVALGLEQVDRWDATRSPFPGLRPFDESYAPVFFGRERQVEQLRQLVDPPSRARQGVVVPVLGPSGSGKSSLVRAGLVAALRPAPDWVVSEPWTPSDAPLAELALALAHAAKRHEVALDADECRDLLTRPSGMQEYLRRLRESAGLPAETRVLVVVDQAEELVTLTAEAERRTFLEALTLSCTPPSPLRVVMTARTDMWDEVSALANRYGLTVAPAVLHVPPLSRADLARVVAEPAKRSHLTLEDGLLQRLVEDTETGDALPLLAYTLQRMTALATDGRLTHALYDGVGGVRGAIASRAAEVAHGARTEAEVAAAVLHLVSSSDNRPVTRVARVDSVPAAQREILDDLVDARLVVVRESAGQQVYAPAHEALFSAWPPLAEMISHRHDDLRLRSRLERRAADWKEAGAGTSGLLTGDELDEATTWQDRNPDLRTPDVTTYLEASQHRARRSRLLRIGVGAVVLALCLALGGLVVLNQRYGKDAQLREAREAAARQLPADNQSSSIHDPAAAAIALLQALELDDGDPESQALARELLSSPMRDVLPQGGQLLKVVVGHDDVLAAGTGGTRIWDLASGRALGDLPLATALAVRRDDRIAVLGDLNGLHGYDLTDPGTPAALATFGLSQDALAFSPDGSILAGVAGSVVTAWDMSDPAAPRELGRWRPGLGNVTAVAALDDGQVLAAGGAGDVARWRVGQAGQVVADPQSSSVTSSLDVDAAGDRALLGGTSVGEGNPVVDLGDGQVLATLAAGEGADLGISTTTYTGTLSRDGSTAVVFDLAGSGYVYRVDDASAVGTLTGGHTALVSQAAYGEDQLIASVALDGDVRLWDAAAAAPADDADLAGQLCTTFGPRIDEESWRIARGDDTFEPPCPRAKAPPAATALAPHPRTERMEPPRDPRGTLLAERFDGPTAFPSGTVPVGTGQLGRQVVAGGYRLSAHGMGSDTYTVWQTVTAEVPAAPYSASVSTRQGSDLGGCGITVGTSKVRVAVAVDRVGHGRVTWFSSGTLAGSSDFAIPSGKAHTITYAADAGRVEVRVDGAPRLSVQDDLLPTPHDVGVVAVGAETTCDFDDLVVSGG